MTKRFDPPAAIWEILEPLSTDSVKVDDDAIIVLRRHGNPNRFEA